MTLIKEEEDFVKELLNQKKRESRIAELMKEMWEKVEVEKAAKNWDRVVEIKRDYYEEAEKL